MDKEDLYGGVLLNCKKEKTLSSVKTWVDLEGVPPGEINQTRKGKYIISQHNNRRKKKKGSLYRHNSRVEMTAHMRIQ